MFKTILATTLAIVLAAQGGPALASAPKGCALAKATLVQPLTTRVEVGHSVQQRLAGATLYIPAEPGLTTDWLKRSADEHQARMARGESMENCVLGVANARIQVWSNNSGWLMVSVQSDNLDNAKEILRRAELVVR